MKEKISLIAAAALAAPLPSGIAQNFPGAPEDKGLTPMTTTLNVMVSDFRADGTAVYGGTSWAPKIEASLLGNGLGMGTSFFYLTEEVGELAPWDDLNFSDCLENSNPRCKVFLDFLSYRVTHHADSQHEQGVEPAFKGGEGYENGI